MQLKPHIAGNMIVNNIFVRFPNIKFVVPHNGSFLPYMIQRFKGVSNILVARKMIEPVDIDANIKNLYFDIAGDPEPNALDMLLTITDEKHILYGSDYPYVLKNLIIEKKKHFENNPKYKNVLNNIQEIRLSLLERKI
jgi:amidohydrolase 2